MSILSDKEHPFVDQETGACTNSIESTWQKFKSRHKEVYGTARALFGTYIAQFCGGSNLLAGIVLILFTMLMCALAFGLPIIIIYILYSFSQVCRYYVRMTMVSASILLAAFLSIFGSSYTYFYNSGGTHALKMVNICCSWLDLDVEVRGEDKIYKASGSEQKPLVLVSNHQSSIDLYVMSFIRPKKCTAMMKNSLKYVPFFNIASILSNSIFVHRYNKERAHLAIKEAVAAMLKKQLKIWVFPEGTRNHGHGMLPFKKGAFNIAIEAQIDVVPIVFSDYTPFYSKPNKYFHCNGKVIAHVMDPISTIGMKIEDASNLCERVRNEMVDVYNKISDEAKQAYEAQLDKKLQ